ncbi:nucleotidyltransferase domain-containing protein [Cytobacillus spongiae]|uniref:nucleotidyltransferase domain-containing protein n=1 Tax=Cytobacillus spongiae TaxID=2901381 RepID=UPI001F417C0E|nr:nucleotidyltransferase domain-containing protein [Cytobacillus spongiae]UII56817.1 nucleotidyltransferase domain-containing protein [Cytobacillus spongiae]
MEESIIELVNQFIKRFYPNASVGMVGGSIIHNQQNRESDIDLLIIDETQESPHLSCYIFEDRKIEAFVFTESALYYQFETARYTGVPTIIKICAEGIIVEDTDDLGGKVKKEAKSTLMNGMAMWSSEDFAKLRYKITDQLYDLRTCKDEGEQLFIVNNLIEGLSELVIRTDGNWMGIGKWRARCLKESNEEVYNKIVQNVDQFFSSHDHKRFSEFVEEILSYYGGELFSNHKEMLF